MLDKVKILEARYKSRYYGDTLTIIDNKLCLIHTYQYAYKRRTKYAIISDKITYYNLEGERIAPFTHTPSYSYKFIKDKHFFNNISLFNRTAFTKKLFISNILQFIHVFKK